MANYKVTMQPGDNFAVAASLNDVYRDSINLNPTDGSKLVNGTNQTIAISGETNSDNSAGLRTRMLTVWRRLHIEVDSMGPAHENYERGNVSESKKKKISPGQTATINVTANPLEVNRFENGRMELAAFDVTIGLDVVSNTANTVTVRNSTAHDNILTTNVNFELLSQTVPVHSAVGTIPVGQTITPNQTVTLNFSGTPLVVNAFSGGSMSISPSLDSLTITANTVNSVNVINNSRTIIGITVGTHLRLYDDDDMYDRGILDGDEGQSAPEPDLSLMSDSDNPATNVFAPAYIRPQCCLPGSHDKVPFVLNISGPMFRDLDPLLSPPYFNNFATQESPVFWTIYLLGGYQDQTYQGVYPNGRDRDGDPLTYHNGIIDTTYGATNCSTTQSARTHDGYGSIIYAEVGRANEYPTGFSSRPVSRAFTTAHEVGHLFQGVHEDHGLMDPTATRTSGIFSDISLSLIRQTTFP